MYRVLACALILPSCSSTEPKPPRLATESLPLVQNTLGHETHSLWFYGGDEKYWYFSQPQLQNARPVNQHYRVRQGSLIVPELMQGQFQDWHHGLKVRVTSSEPYTLSLRIKNTDDKPHRHSLDRYLDDSLPSAICEAIENEGDDTKK